MARLRLQYSTWRYLEAFARERAKLRWRDRVYYHWSSLWFSVTDQMLLGAYGAELNRVEICQDPLFVVGFWRSGTTLLHELLCQDPQFGFPTTAQCFNPALPLLRRRQPKSDQVLVKRPMDQIYIGPHSPQEDEFALLSLGAPSVYRALLVPSLLEEMVDNLGVARLSDADQRTWRELFLNFLRRVSFADSRRLVLKSPSHTFRIELLTQMFPRAQFVLILRDPYDTWASNLKLWNALFRLYALHDWEEDTIRSFLCKAYQLMLQKVQVARRSLPPSRYCEIRFESLEKHPMAALENIYCQFDLSGFPQARSLMQAYLDRNASYARDRYYLKPSEISYINDCLGSFINALGYPLRTAWSRQQSDRHSITTGS